MSEVILGGTSERGSSKCRNLHLRSTDLQFNTASCSIREIGSFRHQSLDAELVAANIIQLKISLVLGGFFNQTKDSSIHIEQT
jgi:hypothetical protein